MKHEMDAGNKGRREANSVLSDIKMIKYVILDVRLIHPTLCYQSNFVGLKLKSKKRAETGGLGKKNELRH